MRVKQYALNPTQKSRGFDVVRGQVSVPLGLCYKYTARTSPMAEDR